MIVQEDPPEEIYAGPGHAFVAEFVGTANFFEGVATSFSEDHLGLIDVRATLACRLSGSAGGLIPGTRITVVVRPEDVEVSREALATDFNVSAAIVEHVTYLGNALGAVRRPSGGSYARGFTLASDSSAGSGCS